MYLYTMAAPQANVIEGQTTWPPASTKIRDPQRFVY